MLNKFLSTAHSISLKLPAIQLHLHFQIIYDLFKNSQLDLNSLRESVSITLKTAIHRLNASNNSKNPTDEIRNLLGGPYTSALSPSHLESTIALKHLKTLSLNHGGF
jgi:hypothetical protein